MINTDYTAENEGFMSTPYLDTRSILTLGYGHNLHASGISRHAGKIILLEDMHAIVTQLHHIRWYPDLNIPRKTVINDIAYNIGVSGLFEFVNMFAALAIEDYTSASEALLDSKLARENRVRTKENARILLSGVM